VEALGESGYVDTNIDANLPSLTYPSYPYSGLNSSQQLLQSLPAAFSSVRAPPIDLPSFNIRYANKFCFAMSDEFGYVVDCYNEYITAIIGDLNRPVKFMKLLPFASYSGGVSPLSSADTIQAPSKIEMAVTPDNSKFAFGFASNTEIKLQVVDFITGGGVPLQIPSVLFAGPPVLDKVALVSFGINSELGFLILALEETVTPRTLCVCWLEAGGGNGRECLQTSLLQAQGGVLDFDAKIKSTDDYKIMVVICWNSGNVTILNIDRFDQLTYPTTYETVSIDLAEAYKASSITILDLALSKSTSFDDFCLQIAGGIASPALPAYAIYCTSQESPGKTSLVSYITVPAVDSTYVAKNAYISFNPDDARSLRYVAQGDFWVSAEVRSLSYNASGALAAKTGNELEFANFKESDNVKVFAITEIVSKVTPSLSFSLPGLSVRSFSVSSL